MSYRSQILVSCFFCCLWATEFALAQNGDSNQPQGQNQNQSNYQSNNQSENQSHRQSNNQNNHQSQSRLDKVQDISSITVSASAKPRPQNIALQRIVLDTTALRLESGNSLGDLLIKSSPINIKSYGRGDVQTATFRGTAPTHTSVYWNGMRINSPMQGMVDFSLIPVYLIDNVTIEAGLSSIGSGSGALGGAISLESAPRWDANPVTVDARLAGGSFSTYNAFAGVRATTKNFQSATKIYGNYSKNDFKFTNRDIIDPQKPGWHPEQRNENGQYFQYGFMQEFYVRLPRNQNLSVIVTGLDSKRNLPQLTSFEGDGGNNLTDRFENSLRAVVTYRKYSDILDITARLMGELSSMSFTQQNRTASGYENTIDSHGSNRSLGASLDLSYKRFRNHTIGNSTSLTLDNVQSMERIKKLGFNRTRFEFSELLGLYSTWNRHFSTSVIARGGVMSDTKIAYISPMIGLEYRPLESVAVKARVGHNTHCPTISDLYYVPGGNPDLKSEKGWTAELSAQFTHKRTSVGVNLFSSWIDNWIVWLPSHQQYWTPQNIKNVLAQGVEITAATGLRLAPHWELELNGTFTINRTINNGDPMASGDASVGKQLVYVPLISGGAFARISWRRAWLTYQIYGESSRNTTTSANSSTMGSIIEPYLLHNLNVGYKFAKYFNLELQCQNLLGTQYYTVLRRPLPLRSFMLVVGFSF